MSVQPGDWQRRAEIAENAASRQFTTIGLLQTEVKRLLRICEERKLTREELGLDKHDLRKAQAQAIQWKRRAAASPAILVRLSELRKEVAQLQYERKNYIRVAERQVDDLRDEVKRLKHLILTNKEYEKLDTLRRVYEDRDEQKRERGNAEADLKDALAEWKIDMAKRDTVEAEVVRLTTEYDFRTQERDNADKNCVKLEEEAADLRAILKEVVEWMDSDVVKRTLGTHGST